MEKPKNAYNSSPTSFGQFMPPNIADPSIRGEAVDQLLENRGINFIHKRSIPCPNLKTLDSSLHVPNCQLCGNDGNIYYGDKPIVGAFLQNTLEKTFEMQGVWEVGTAIGVFPTEYSDGTQCDLNTFDKLVIPDFTVRVWEQIEYEPTTDNKQILRLPVYNVDYMAGVRSGSLKEYIEGVDFRIGIDFKIEWLKKPYYDQAIKKGEVISISYYSNPVYIVLHPLRELRVSQQMINGQKVARRLPQSVVLKRDFLVNKRS